MAAAFLDTSVIIDLLRGYPPAHLWYAAQHDPGVCRIVWMEIIEGLEDGNAQRQALKLLRRFELVELTTVDIIWATEKLLVFNLSHNIDAFDCLIASVNQRMQLPLYTRNLKHSVPLIGELAQ